MQTIWWVISFFMLISFISNIYLYFRQKKILNKLHQLTDLGNDLNGSATQVDNISQDIAHASIEQLDSITDTISASHEINMMVKKTSENSKTLSNEAIELKKLTEKGENIVQNMVSSSDLVKDGNQHFKSQMQESMDALAKSLGIINGIADKTKLINDIVFQTKLLSFNASVEAARAGEHGKGFAVVAEEVGKLAQMSGAAANEIASIVSQAVNEVSSAINNTKKRVESLTSDISIKIEDGNFHAKNCETIFHSISDKTLVTNKMIEEIYQASNEQSEGVNQLDNAISSLQEVANRNKLVASQLQEYSHQFISQTSSLLAMSQDINMSLDNEKFQSHLKEFVWKKELETGVAEMDDEHKILVKKINILVENLEKSRESKKMDLVQAAFHELALFVISHFKNEEEFMRSVQYPHLDSHIKIHENLLNKVGQFAEALKNNNLDDQKLVSFLNSWLLSHIMGVDMQYGEHVAASTRNNAHQFKKAS